MHSATTEVASPTYDAGYFEVLARVEDRHFWFQARNRLIHALAAQLIQVAAAPRRVLEVGCGNGNVLRWLRSACSESCVIGLDLFPEGLSLAKARTGASVVSADIFRLPFRESFNLVGIFDVLEHLDEDGAALAAVGSIMPAGGQLMITVPASESLWSYFDVAAHHRRRYDPVQLRRTIENSGFQVDFLSPFMATIYPLVYAGRKLASWHGKSAKQSAEYDLKIVPGVNEALAFVLRQEMRFLTARRVLPFGTSLLALAHKK